jgi:glycosyltransferase involved in cell wall biosynthesis
MLSAARSIPAEMRLSILTPAFNEAGNLPVLYERLVHAMTGEGVEWEWVIVDDHSRDATFAAIEGLATRDPRVRGIRLARNSGSHVAITCGLHEVDGDAAVMMAADLQDPPETIAAMLARWRQGAQVVWAVRRERPGDHHHAGFATLYYWIMRRLVGMSEMPARGADFFLVDRVVIDAFRRCAERHVSVLALITSLGFRQEQIEYDKQQRLHGQSGWTLSKKLKLVIDSVTAFSEFPIRLCSYGGLLLIAAGLATAIGGVLVQPGLSAGILLVLAVMIGLTGVQLLALGVVGEYVWRVLEQSRGRPIYLIEATTGPAVAGRPSLHKAAVE